MLKNKYKLPLVLNELISITTVRVPVAVARDMDLSCTVNRLLHNSTVSTTAFPLYPPPTERLECDCRWWYLCIAEKRRGEARSPSYLFRNQCYIISCAADTSYPGRCRHLWVKHRTKEAHASLTKQHAAVCQRWIKQWFLRFPFTRVDGMSGPAWLIYLPIKWFVHYFLCDVCCEWLFE